MKHDVWEVGDAYEAYVGRWSREVARSFVRWLEVPPQRRWLDVGCGTGALTASVLALAEPTRVIGVDMSEGFLAQAREQTADPRAEFALGDAQSLTLPDRHVDAVVGGLSLNFVSDPSAAVAESTRVVCPDGVVAAYVWDYAEGMAMMRYFWDAAAEVDSAVHELDEGRRFSICRPDSLRDTWERAGLDDVVVRPIDVPTVFDGFDDYWSPFLGGQGSAPGYLVSLPETQQRAIRDIVRGRLPVEPDGGIRLTARAWAVRGRRPQ